VREYYEKKNKYTESRQNTNIENLLIKEWLKKNKPTCLDKPMTEEHKAVSRTKFKD